MRENRDRYEKNGERTPPAWEDRPPVLAVVVPCYNEEEMLPRSVPQLLGMLDRLTVEGRVAPESWILFVDDGSGDGTCGVIERFRRSDVRVGLLRLSANTGHQRALMAGLETAAGRCDLALSVDADLQDDLEVVGKMVDAADKGADIVFGVRRDRSSDSWFKRNSALLFYNTMHRLGVETVYNHADFRLMSSRALEALAQYSETNLFLRGIVAQLGFRRATVFYDRRPRLSGKSKYPLGKMINFMLDGITSFSVRPVRMIFGLGILFTLTGIAIFIYSSIRYFQGHTVAGWTSLMLSIWFCTGILLMALGVIGEYLGKIYTEVKRRPRYHVESLQLPAVSADSKQRPTVSKDIVHERQHG